MEKTKNTLGANLIKWSAVSEFLGNSKSSIRADHLEKRPNCKKNNDIKKLLALVDGWILEVSNK